jgi:hypothetical protein
MYGAHYAPDQRIMSGESSRKLPFILAIAGAAIVGVHVCTLIAGYAMGRDTLFGITAMFDLDGERNVPAVFSTCLLLIAAWLLVTIARRQPRGVKPRALLWYGLSALFVYLAADEFLEVHERVGNLTAHAVGAKELTYYAWLIPYAVIALVFGILYLRFLTQLDRATRIRFLVSASFYVLGAMGAELIAGVYVHYYHTEQALGYDLLSALEETLEMTGVIWFIRALTLYPQKNSAPMQQHRGAISTDDSRTSTSA